MIDEFEEKERGIGINIELFKLNNLVAIFWEDKEGNWQGVIKENVCNGDYRIIRNEKVIMCLYNEALLEASAI